MLCMSMLVLMAVASPGGAGASQTDDSVSEKRPVPKAGEDGVKNEGVGLYTGSFGCQRSVDLHDQSNDGELRRWNAGGKPDGLAIVRDADALRKDLVLPMNHETGVIKGPWNHALDHADGRRDDGEHQAQVPGDRGEWRRQRGGPVRRPPQDRLFGTRPIRRARRPTKWAEECRFGGELFSGNIVARK